MACGVCPPVAAGSESLIAQASDVAPATPTLDPQPPPLPDPSTDPPPLPGPSTDPEPLPGPSTDPEPKPGPSADPEPLPGPSTDPEPLPGPSTDPEPLPGPSTDPEPQPDPSTDPEPQPDPATDPQPDADPEPDPDQASDDEPAPGDTAGERPSGEHAGETRPPAPAAAGAATQGTQASVHAAPPADFATAALPGAAVVEAATDPTTRTAARRTSVVVRSVCGEPKPMALDLEPGQLVPDLLTALRAQTEQRETRARARASGASVRKPHAARRDSTPAPILPLGPCRDTVAGSAAGPGGIAPSPLGCVICTADAVRAAHELRRLRAPLLALDLPGLPSLRDRPG